LESVHAFTDIIKAADHVMLTQEEAQLLQRDRATRHVNKFVLCFTSYMGVRKVLNSKSYLQGHSRAFVRPHTISY